MTPDFMYTMHQSRHQQLCAEAERERAPSDSTGFAAWLRRFDIRGAVGTRLAS